MLSSMFKGWSRIHYKKKDNSKNTLNRWTEIGRPWAPVGADIYLFGRIHRHWFLLLFFHNINFRLFWGHVDHWLSCVTLWFRDPECEGATSVEEWLLPNELWESSEERERGQREWREARELLYRLALLSAAGRELFVSGVGTDEEQCVGRNTSTNRRGTVQFKTVFNMTISFMQTERSSEKRWDSLTECQRRKAPKVFQEN